MSAIRLAIALGMFTTFSAQSASAWEPLRAHPQNPYILEFREQPVVLRTFAEHYSSVINSNFDFIPYLDTLQRDKMNLTRVFLAGFRHDSSDTELTPLAPTPAQFMQPWPRTSTHGNALDGLGKWDFSAWNEAYFDRLNAFTQACSDRGVAIEMTFFCTQYDEVEWQASPFNPANNVQGYGAANRFDNMRPVDPSLLEVQEAVVRRIVNEVNRFDNIYFEIQNEPFWNQPGIMDGAEIDFHLIMLAAIRTEEAGLPNQHLVAHNFPQHADALGAGFDVINEHYPVAVLGVPVAGAEALLRDHYSRGRILSLDETYTANGALQSRLEAWMFFHGGGGIYNGLDVPYFVYSAEDETGDGELGRVTREILRNVGTYLDNLHLVALRRDLSWITEGIPQGATLQAMASPGQQYVAYLYHGQSGLANFQLSYDPIDDSSHSTSLVVVLEEGTWRAVWSRPADLAEIHVEEFTHPGGTHTLGPVNYPEDVALRIDRTGTGDATPPPAPTGLVAISAADGPVTLSWNPVRAADLAAYQIYRAEDPSFPIDESHRIAVLPAADPHLSDGATVVGTTYHYRVTAVDLTGNESAASRETTITSGLNAGPVATADFYSTPESTVLVVPANGVLANDTDPASLPLTAVLDAAPGRGTVALAADGSFTYTPAAGYFGTDSFTYHADNGHADSNVVTVGITLHEVIPAPVAVADVYSTNANTALVVVVAGLLANDTDPRSRPLTALLDLGVAHGSLILNPDGGFTYTPDAGYSGTDTFTYHARNGVLDSNVVTVNLTIIDVVFTGLVNGSFESGYQSWTTTGNQSIKLSGPSVAATDGTKLVAFNDGNRTPNGVLTQSFATAPGQTYALAFDVGVLFYNPNSQTLQVTVTGSSSLLTRTITLNGLGGGTSRWLSQRFTFAANSATTTLTFRDQSTSTNSLDLLLDKVRVTGPPPIVPNTAPLAAADTYSTNENIALVVAAAGVLANDTDADSNPLTAVLNVGPTHGNLTLNSNGSFTYTPATNFFGNDSFTYHANDGTANSNVATASITVHEVIPAPVAADDGFPTNESIALVVATNGLLANDTDPESRPLTAVLDVGPAHGSLALETNGTFTYTPAVGYFGSDSFTYHARNGFVNSNIATVSLTVHEIIPSPLAAGDSYITNENIALVVPTAGVLTNDSDPRFRPLTAVLDAGPGHGALTLNANGSFTYTPVTHYFGSDSFTYHARNGFLDSNLVTVNLTVNEVIPPPVATEDAYSTNEGIALVVSTDGLLANDTDPQSRPLTAGLDVGPSHGTLDLNPNGNFTYTPAAGYFGSDSFTYHARNGFVDSNIATASITLREIIPPPVATDNSYVTNENTALVVPAAGVLANDSDPRSRPLTAILNDGPAHGILVLNPNGSFTYTPAADYFGSDSFTYHARNGFLDSNIATVNLTVNEVVFTGLANGSFESDFSSWTSTGNLGIQSAPPYAPTHGTKLVAFNSINRTPNALLAQSFATVAGQTYTLAFDAGVLAYNTNSQIMLVTVTGTGSLLSRTVTIIGSGAGTCRWIPQSFTFVANSTSATLAFKDQSTSTINIDMLLDNVRVNIGQAPVNRAPVAVADTYSANAGTQLIIPSAGVLANDTDPDANPLTALLNVGPSHGVLALNTNGSFTYTPASGYTGADAFTYHAYDGNLNSNVVTVSITVNPVATTNFVNGSFESDYAGWIKSGNQGIKNSVALNLASNGTKYVTFNSGNTAPNGILSQTFATIAGTTYTLAFDVGVLDYVNQQQRLQCTVDGATNLLTRTITLQGTANRAIRWTPQSMTFVANSTSTALTFRDLSTTTNSIDMQLDNVRVTTAAASTALLSAGSPSSMVGSSKITVEPPAPGNPTLSGVPGDFTIRMTATRAGDYVLERSEDLKTWERISKLQLIGPGTVEFHDKAESAVPEAPPARRFYRIGLLPEPDSR